MRALALIFLVAFTGVTHAQTQAQQFNLTCKGDREARVGSPDFAIYETTPNIKSGDLELLRVDLAAGRFCVGPCTFLSLATTRGDGKIVLRSFKATLPEGAEYVQAEIFDRATGVKTLAEAVAKHGAPFGGVMKYYRCVTGPFTGFPDGAKFEINHADIRPEAKTAK